MTELFLSGQKTIAEESLILPLVQRLLDAFEVEQVRYCHWKSNDALDRSATGLNDLDLLVDCNDGAAFREIMGRLGFKEAFAAQHEAMPGVLDFFGYDESVQRLVHVHAHFQLVVGQDLTKNYRIPLEEAFLSNQVRRKDFFTPIPELDYILYVLRLTIKHSVWDVQLLGFGELSQAERSELSWLEERIDPDVLERVCQRDIPWLDPALFQRCVRALEPGTGSLGRMRTAAALQRTLSPFGRRTALMDAWVKIRRRFTIGLRRKLFGYRSGRKLANGGRIVAIVGGDGSGKTTVLDGVEHWLGGELHIERVHMGRPPWSVTTLVVRTLFKVGALLGLTRYVSTQHVLAEANEPGVRRFPGYALLARELCISRDRALHYRRVRQMAARGALVIADRFPVADLHALDGPVMEKLVPEQGRTWLHRWLIRRDQRYYQSFQPPDLLLVLRVHPDVAVARKKDEASDYVWRRSYDVWTWSANFENGTLIDASAPVTEVLPQVQQAIWERL